MSDLIERKEAIEWVQNILATHIYYHPCSKSRNVPIDEVIDRLERVPSIDAVPHWIPCEERLPEEGLVVVTVDKDGDYEINAIIDEEDCEWFWEKPVAWMPLPKPYKEQ